MRHRTFIMGFCLGVSGMLALRADPAAAQTAPTGKTASAATPTGPDTPAASDLPPIYKAAFDAYKRGDYQQAVDGFLKVWSVEKKPKTAGNLGRAEMKLRRYRDAAEHLSFFLRNQDEIPPADQREAEDLLAEAKKRVATVRVEINRPGAGVSVDGTSVDATVVVNELFVEPGLRTIKASVGGFEDSSTISAVAGKTHKVTLDLTLPADGNPDGKNDKPPVTPPPLPKPSSAPTIVTWIGVGLGVAAVGAGVGLLVEAENQKRLAAEERATVPGNDCIGAARVACSSVNGHWQQSASFGTLGITALVAGGLIGATTLGHFLTRSRGGQTRTGSIIPVVGPHDAGVKLTYTW